MYTIISIFLVDSPYVCFSLIIVLEQNWSSQTMVFEMTKQTNKQQQ